MRKKLASDLTSLAHAILKMKDKDDLLELKKKAYEVYEKLSVLAYVEEYINTTPNAKTSKEELIHKITEAENRRTDIEPDNVENTISAKKSNQNFIRETAEKKVVEADVFNKNSGLPEESQDTSEEKNKSAFNFQEKTEETSDKPNKLSLNSEKDQQNSDKKASPTLEEELNDTLPVDVMANLFEKVESKKSLNDHLQDTIQIGLNDRIAFVKHLFKGNQSDFNRVISQLNTCKTEKEAKKFINKLVKPDYDWSEKEEYETRLLDIIERRFA